MTRSIPWPRILAEGFAIVVSILLAFGIQAWWEERQERALEHDALGRMEAEFIEMDAILKQWRTYHTRSVDAADVLLANTRSDAPPSVSSDSVAVLVGATRLAWTLDPPFATVSALESSGQFAAIRSQDLLVKLASFRALIADLQDDERDLKEIKHGYLIPYLYQSVSFRTMPTEGERGEIAPAQTTFPVGFDEVLGDRQFENLIADIQRRELNTVDNYDAAVEDVSALLAMIREELGG